MNTSKQVNVMVGLLMVFAIGTLLYFLWDSARAEDAGERQMEANAERGGKLYAINCRACHGLTGKGALENATLPGLPLDTEDNRPTDPGKLRDRQQRIRDTMKCGRVGTLMPSWSQEQGGPLNDSQIEQLVILITSAASQKGWENALEQANHTDLLGKLLAAPVGASETMLPLTNARGLKANNLLRIDQEAVRIVDAPVETRLLEDVDAEATEVMVEGTKGFGKDDIVQVGDEKMRVTSASGDLLRVERGVEGTAAAKHRREQAVFEVGDQIQVERGVQGTQAAAHEAGAEVYNGPIVPPTGPLTGEQGTPPCGQRAAAPAATTTPQASPGPQASPVPVTGSVSLEMGDNFFQLNGQRNPSLTVKKGESVTINLKNNGLAMHNMRTAGEDNEYTTGDDDVSNPQMLSSGGEGTLVFTFDKAGTYDYHCDFHPADMKGQLVVTE